MTLPPPLLEQLSIIPASAPKPRSMFLDDSRKRPVVSAMSLYKKEAFLEAIKPRNHKLSEVL